MRESLRAECHGAGQDSSLGRGRRSASAKHPVRIRGIPTAAGCFYQSFLFGSMANRQQRRAKHFVSSAAEYEQINPSRSKKPAQLRMHLCTHTWNEIFHWMPLTMFCQTQCMHIRHTCTHNLIEKRKKLILKTLTIIYAD